MLFLSRAALNLAAMYMYIGIPPCWGTLTCMSVELRWEELCDRRAAWYSSHRVLLRALPISIRDFFVIVLAFVAIHTAPTMANTYVVLVPAYQAPGTSYYIPRPAGNWTAAPHTAFRMESYARSSSIQNPAVSNVDAQRTGCWYCLMINAFLERSKHYVVSICSTYIHFRQGA